MPDLLYTLNTIICSLLSSRPTTFGRTRANEAFAQLVREIEVQSMENQQKIAVARSQRAAKQREERLAQLTKDELSSLPPQTNVYEGVGKMYVHVTPTQLRPALL